MESIVEVKITEGMMMVAKHKDGKVFAHRIVQGNKEIDVLKIKKEKEEKDGS